MNGRGGVKEGKRSHESHEVTQSKARRRGPTLVRVREIRGSIDLTLPLVARPAEARKKITERKRSAPTRTRT